MQLSRCTRRVSGDGQRRCFSAAPVPPALHTARSCVTARAAAPSARGADDVEHLHAQIAHLTAEVKELQRSSTRPASRRTYISRDDYDALPHRIILLRHAESQGNVSKLTYCQVPDNAVPLTEQGRLHAREVGQQLRGMLEKLHGPQLRVFLMTSPYRRTLETTDEVLEAFTDDQVVGVRMSVQLRELDYGNFQQLSKMNQAVSERQAFGRFWFRFDNGESCSDVYDRLTSWEDHLTRDMLRGRFEDASLVLVTHGITLRIFLMRWFHWTVGEFLEVYNPNNVDPIVLEKLPWQDVLELQDRNYAHAKHCYAITPESQAKLRGMTPSMASYFSRKARVSPKESWSKQRDRMMERYTVYAPGGAMHGGAGPSCEDPGSGDSRDGHDYGEADACTSSNSSMWQEGHGSAAHDAGQHGHHGFSVAQALQPPAQTAEHKQRQQEQQAVPHVAPDTPDGGVSTWSRAGSPQEHETADRQ